MKLHALGIFASNFTSLIYALIGFGLLITIHECGHFMFCKMFGVHTPTFSIGMGPKLYQKKIGETDFRLSLIPIGGYVEIAGMAEVGQGDQAQAKLAGARSFRAKPYWQKFLILIGGILFNLLFAYFALSTVFWIPGMPRKEVELVVNKLPEKAEEEEAVDLRVGDRLVALDGQELSAKPRELFPMLRKLTKKISDEKRSVVVEVMRKPVFDVGTETVESIGGATKPTPKGVVAPTELLSGVSEPLEEVKVAVTIPASLNGKKAKRGLLGGAAIGINETKLWHERYPLFGAIRAAVKEVHIWIGIVLSGLKILVTERNLKDFGGPVQIVGQSFKMAQKGFVWLLVFLAIISINLAIINLLPLGALDGGQLVFETIEAIIRRPIPEVIRFSINLASWFLIIGLILYLSYQDIMRYIFG